MGFISRRKKNNILSNTSIEREFASEIVEIFEEKLEELNVTLPGLICDNEDREARIKSKVKKELISEIEDFIYANKKTLFNKIA